MSFELMTDFLERNAKLYPNHIAYADVSRQMSYEEVNFESNKIASVLFERGYFRKPILIYMEKTAECLTSFMGVLKSGNFYCPLDVNMPLEKARKIMDTLSPACVIYDGSGIVPPEDIAPYVETVSYSELVRCECDMDMVPKIREKIIENDLAYILFTSGSTGIPKGVAIGHKALTSYTKWVTKAMHFDVDTVFGCQHPFLFSASVTDIYGTLMSGGTLWIIPQNLFRAPIKLLKWLNSTNINTLYWVPSALAMVSKGDTFNEIKPEKITKVLFVGEPMPPVVLQQWIDNCKPGTLFANLFGPTETVDICVYYIIPKSWHNDGNPVPIGKSCEGCDSFVVTDDNRMATVNEIGELCVRGPILAYGYYNNPEKTAHFFVQNPLQNAYPETVYRTGDLVSVDMEGVIHYHGRKDNQIKIMGYRIELGEIENAVSTVDEVESNCCLFDKFNKIIICIYKGNIDKSTIRKCIKGKLDRYKIPHRFIQVNEMPLNGSRKIDRVKLKQKYIEKSN